jgi:HEAT repeat protein
MAQGFGGTQGVGLLLDVGGNDSYFAGGKYPCGWLPGHNFSLSQGFGYGMRPFAGGGIGILCDLKGDDHYVGDVYGQGASYWYSVGLLLDAEGNDTYEAHQYCQGAGIHLSSGAQIDWAGNDTYTASHICQGAAHDYAVGMLIDRAGNDKYKSDTTAQGSAINNSFAMLLDHGGDDTYAGTDPKQSQAAGHDGDKREYGSIALLLDLAGQDTYSQGQSNNAVWLKPWYGAGLDAVIVGRAAGLPKPETTAGGPPALQSTGNRLYTIAPVDPHRPIERLLRLAISDKPDAGKAWDELKQRGTEALAYLLTRLDSPNVLVRAKTEEIIDHLGTNSIPLLIAGIDAAKNEEAARLCCYFLARFNKQARAAIPHVLPLLNRDKTRPTAFYALGHLRAREAFAPALAALNERELVRLRGVQALGRIGDRRAIRKLIAKLDDEIYDVRYAAEDALVALGKSSISPLRSAFAKAGPRARPHIVEALVRLKDRRALILAGQEYRNDDSLVRNAIMRSLQSALTGGK